eukprot:TRINITY_DN80386_c0_g1_i1.p1 TRINITY_DN80386_c0_g1~~TRINITY_DN80386_c0_g1_i1.p1  ORF type:complete len:371 (-),score=57.07 TRINITY_DN80386_c0_g1_i1:216-1202(-)
MSSDSRRVRLRRESRRSSVGLLAFCLVKVVTAAPRKPQAQAALSVPGVNAVAKVADSSHALNIGSASKWLEQHTGAAHVRAKPSEDYIKSNTQFALRARQDVPAAATVPEALFLREVLPYQQLDEPLDEWRPLFYEKLSPLAKRGKTLREVVDLVVPAAFAEMGRPVEFKPNCTPAVMAPVSETLKNGYASCTGCSIFLVDALRSVGVPARVVGTAQWNLPTGGNHNWVEVWTGDGSGDGWHFFDAAPTKRVEWDRGWFVPGNVKEAVEGGIHGIFTPVWDEADADATYTITWREPSITMPALDRTRFYKNLQTACPECPYTGLPEQK